MTLLPPTSYSVLTAMRSIWKADDATPDDQIPLQDDEESLQDDGLPLHRSQHTNMRKPPAWMSSSWTYRAAFIKFGIICVAFFTAFQLSGLVSTLYGDKLSRYSISTDENGLSEDSTNQTNALVVASFEDQNMTWAEQVTGWNIVRYVADDLEADLTVPRNQGREAMAYLTYIINNYHRLPPYIAFVHGHESSWHQAVRLPLLLRAINLTLVEEQGFQNLRCSTEMTCKGHELDRNYVGDDFFGRVGTLFKSFHDHVFRPTDPWYTPPPDLLTSVNGAQFVVSRTAIREVPLDYWVRVRQPLGRDLDELHSWWNSSNPVDSYFMGVLYERSWEYLFKRVSTDCMDEQVCWETAYQNRIVCDNPNGHFWLGAYVGAGNCSYVE